jgi:hypothetical protein
MESLKIVELQASSFKSEFVGRQRVGKKKWRENNLDIRNARKHNAYKPQA